MVLTATDRSDGKARKAAKKRLKGRHPHESVRQQLQLYEGYVAQQSAIEHATPAGTIFAPCLVIRRLEQESGPRRQLDLLCAPQVAQRWRDAILTQVSDAPEPVRQLLSGHDHGGAPLEGPHLAFVPLTFVGHPHADGRLLGMGLALPEAIAPEERRHALRAIARIDRLVLGSLGVWRIGGILATERPWNLRPQVWTAHPVGATHWCTVTPIAFDRHPKSADHATNQHEVAQIIAQSCVRIGLPEPKEVIVTPVSIHLGVPPAYAFPRIKRKDGSQRRHAHAILVFDEPVRGPILIGAGRFRGYGVCRPLSEESGVRRQGVKVSRCKVSRCKVSR